MIFEVTPSAYYTLWHRRNLCSPPPSLNIWLVQRVQESTVATFTSSTTRVMGGWVYFLESVKRLSLCGRQWWSSHHSIPAFRKPLLIAKCEPHPLRSAHVYNCVCKSQDHINFKSEEVRQEAGPDVIWRLADAAWLHSFCVWTSHCLYLDNAYLYLRLYLRGTVHYLLAYCLVNPKNWSLWWKLRGTAVKKPQVWSPLNLYRHVIISFMTFWPCRTSSGHAHSVWKMGVH